MTTTSSQAVAAASPGDADPLLVVRDLRVEAPGTRGGGVTLLEEVAFALDEGRTLGVVGETGSGKTLVALSVLGLLPAGVRRVSGQVRFGGQDLAALGPRGLRSIRGREIGMVFQDPVGHLDPSFTVGSQLVETLRAHTDLTRRAARERAAAAAKAGLMSTSISLDGMGATHDRLRAVDGSYSAALRSMKHLRDAGVPVSVNTQINRLTQHELPALLEVLIENRVHAWQLQLTVPMGRAADEPAAPPPVQRQTAKAGRPRPARPRMVASDVSRDPLSQNCARAPSDAT